HGRSVRDADGYLYVRNARPDGSPWIGPSDSIRSPSHGALVDLRGESPDRLSPAQRDVFASPRPAEELYFTPDDPGQVSDLIDDAGHADKRDELRGILDRWQAATADDLPDDPSVTFMDLGTGEVLPKYVDERGRRRSERYMRTAPGEASGASRVNDPGPF
ncbi:MAG: heparan N-sulfatase, partial [Planctomycetota bacterium]